MTLLSEASFLVTPNGYKEDKLYAAIPTNGNGDMTFTRATTATRVNEAGLVELVPYNLLLRSQEFDNNTSFQKNLSSVSANTTTAPDGTLTADTWTGDGTSGSHYLAQTVSATSGVAYTQSVFAKKGTNNFLQIVGTTAIYDANSWANFDLENGVVGTAGISATATITDFGNGWYRCTMTATATATASGIGFQLGLITSAGSARVETNSLATSVHLWGAQLVEGSSALTYQKTVDRLDIPRIDYTGGGCPSILLEPQRTNLLTYSEQFDNAAWTKSASSITANTIVSPDGTVDADKLVEDTANTAHNINRSQGVTTGASYAFTVYAKAAERSFFRFQSFNAIGDAENAVFDLATGTIFSQSGTSASTITPVGNGWYRCSVIVINDTDTSSTFSIQLYSDGTTSSYTGDGYSGIYIWGAQLEAGAYPTSYIPTTTATVTRNADVITKTGISDLIGQTEGTVFMDINWEEKSGVYYIVSISAGSVTNEIYMAFGNSFNNSIRFSITSGGVSSVSRNSSVLTSGRYKIAFAYANNDATAYINGTPVFTDNTVSVPSTSIMKFLRANNTAGYSGTINASALWKTRLTNAELISLTTL
jgi:hypothetical protein